MPHPKISQWRLLWLIPAFGVAIIAALWIAVGYQLQREQALVLEAARRDTQSRAKSLAEHTEQILGGADRMALLVKYEFEKDGRVDLARMLRRDLIPQHDFFAVSVADRSGTIVSSTRGDVLGLSVAGRHYFRLNESTDTRQLNISRPLMALSGREAIFLTRRLSAEDGSFAGAVILATEHGFFDDAYQESELGKHGLLEVIRFDATVLARRSAGDLQPTDASKNVADVLALAQGADAGTFQTSAMGDEPDRIYAFQVMRPRSLVVVAAQANDEIFAEYERHRSAYLTFAGLVSVILFCGFALCTLQVAQRSRDAHELDRQRRLLRTILDNVPIGIVVRRILSPTQTQVVVWNRRSEAIYGVSSAIATGKTPDDLLSPEAVTEVKRLDRDMLEHPRVQDERQVLEGPAGTDRRIIHLVRAPMFNERSAVEYVVAIASDITDEEKRTDEVRLASKVYETTADGIIITDRDDRIVMVNPAFTHLTGFSSEEVIGKILGESPFRPLDPEASHARFAQQLRDGHVSCEVERRHKDGRRLVLWVTATLIRNDAGAIINNVRVFSDISRLKESQQRLEMLARQDPLTGLANRREFYELLERAVASSRRSDRAVGLLFIDLNDFKPVNDALGHAMGDLVLKEIALRLESCIRANDRVFRLGGDEFTIILDVDRSCDASIALVVARIVAALDAPIVLDGHAVDVSASIGAASLPQDADDASTLMLRADTAMYQAKKKKGAGSHFHHYSTHTFDGEGPRNVAILRPKAKLSTK